MEHIVPNGRVHTALPETSKDLPANLLCESYVNGAFGISGKEQKRAGSGKTKSFILLVLIQWNREQDKKTSCLCFNSTLEAVVSSGMISSHWNSQGCHWGCRKWTLMLLTHLSKALQAILCTTNVKSLEQLDSFSGSFSEFVEITSVGKHFGVIGRIFDKVCSSMGQHWTWTLEVTNDKCLTISCLLWWKNISITTTTELLFLSPSVSPRASLFTRKYLHGRPIDIFADLPLVLTVDMCLISRCVQPFCGAKVSLATVASDRLSHRRVWGWKFTPPHPIMVVHRIAQFSSEATTVESTIAPGKIVSLLES